MQASITLTLHTLVISILLLVCTNAMAFVLQDEKIPAPQTIPAVSKAETEKKPNDEADSKTVTINESSKTAVETPLPVPLNQQHQEDLTHYLAANQIKPLLVGSDDYLTLITENMSVNNKGVAILIPDWQQGATNPKAINFLRNTLPQQGWTTISIQTDSKPQNYPSSALKVAEQQQENKTLIDEYQVKFGTMLNAVINKASEYPGIVMIVVQGNNGALLVELLSEDNEQVTITKQPNVVVLLSSYLSTNNHLIDEANIEFAKKIAYSEYPILDLFLRYDHPIVLAKAKQRLAISQKEMKVYYRQRQLNNNSVGYYPEQELLTQINGWLKSIGW